MSLSTDLMVTVREKANPNGGEFKYQKYEQIKQLLDICNKESVTNLSKLIEKIFDDQCKYNSN